MTNNDVLRRIRYILDYNDPKMVSIFKLGNYNVARATVSSWLTKEDDPVLLEISDRELSIFLNGLIIEKRGKREGPQPQPQPQPVNDLSNNMILRQLRIAFDLKTDDILDLLASIDKKISKHELSSFFRNPNHKSYQQCMDQYLRNFLNALQTKYRKPL